MKTRIIAKLDVKPPYVVKPVVFDGLRKIGLPSELGFKYYKQGADEIFYIDIVSSLYRRRIIHEEVVKSCEGLFVPFAVGGGVTSIDDFSQLFNQGADKVVINTFALQSDPSIINKAAKIFGNQSVVVNIEAKRWDDWYECYSDGGRIRSNKNVLDWTQEVEERGAGEIIIQSVDNDGRQRGFDLDLVKLVVESVNIPVVAASGAGTLEDVCEVILHAKPSGVALASILHYDKHSIVDIKKYLSKNGIEVSR